MQSHASMSASSDSFPTALIKCPSWHGRKPYCYKIMQVLCLHVWKTEKNAYAKLMHGMLHAQHCKRDLSSRCMRSLLGDSLRAVQGAVAKVSGLNVKVQCVIRNWLNRCSCMAQGM